MSDRWDEELRRIAGLEREAAARKQREATEEQQRQLVARLEDDTSQDLIRVFLSKMRAAGNPGARTLWCMWKEPRRGLLGTKYRERKQAIGIGWLVYIDSGESSTDALIVDSTGNTYRSTPARNESLLESDGIRVDGRWTAQGDTPGTPIKWGEFYSRRLERPLAQILIECLREHGVDPT